MRLAIHCFASGLLFGAAIMYAAEGSWYLALLDGAGSAGNLVAAVWSLEP